MGTNLTQEQNNSRTITPPFPIRSHQLFFKEIIRRKTQVWLKVLSGSMAPIAPIGSKVLVTPIDDHVQIRFGDIILFEGKDTLIIHRILGKHRNGKNTLYLQGGDNYCQPSLIRDNQVLGKVISIQKNGRLIQLDTFRGKILNIYFALLTRINFHFDKLIINLKEEVLQGRKIIFIRFVLKMVRSSLRYTATTTTKVLIEVAEKPYKRGKSVFRELISLNLRSLK